MAESVELKEEVIEGVTVYRVSRAHTTAVKTQQFRVNLVFLVDHRRRL